MIGKSVLCGAVIVGLGLTSGCVRRGSASARKVDDLHRTSNGVLDRLDNVEGVFRRALVLEKDGQKAYKPGSTHTWAAFTSASTGGGFGGNTRFVIQGKRGKDVKAYSANPTENEVLFKAGTRVRVTEESEERDSVLHIHVEEVDDGEV